MQSVKTGLEILTLDLGMFDNSRNRSKPPNEPQCDVLEGSIKVSESGCL